MKKILLLMVFCLLTDISWATNYCKDANIVNCYPAQENTGTTLTDRSTNGNNGTFASSGNPAWATSAPSRTYLTYSLNYTTGSQWVTIPNTTWMKPGQGHTMVMWVYPTTSTNTRIYDRNGNNFLFGGAPANSLSMSISAATTALVVNTNASTVTFNTWNHIAMTWDGSSTATNVHIYVNGVEVGYSTQQNAIGAITDQTGSTLYLGNRSAGDRNLQGKVTEIAFFNRVLSSLEVSDIYNNGLLGQHTNIINNATINNATIN